MPGEDQKLSEMLLGGPAAEVVPEEPGVMDEGAEDEAMAFQDFMNEELPMPERLDSLKFLIEMANAKPLLETE